MVEVPMVQIIPWSYPRYHTPITPVEGGLMFLIELIKYQKRPLMAVLCMHLKSKSKQQTLLRTPVVGYYNLTAI